MKLSRRAGYAGVVFSAVALAASLAGVASGKFFSSWGPAVNAESVPGASSELNTSGLDGCPIESPDGLRLYMASTRPGSVGIDIWVARRVTDGGPWGAPERLPEPVNSTANDFCPTPVRGNGLFFVSTRGGGCGGADIYFTRRNPVHGWGEPEHLRCAADGGPNSAEMEMGPSYFEAGGRGYLYFSSGADIYVSEQGADGEFGPAVAVAELNTSFADLRPNVRKDGREVVFDSSRPGGLGGFDIYAATRADVGDPWSAPVNLGESVNSEHGESRASLSWDGERLTFGSDRPEGEGGSDVYVSTRERTSGPGA